MTTSPRIPTRDHLGRELQRLVLRRRELERDLNSIESQIALVCARLETFPRETTPAPLKPAVEPDDPIPYLKSCTNSGLLYTFVINSAWLSRAAEIKDDSLIDQCNKILESIMGEITRRLYLSMQLFHQKPKQ
jgi:hypothetical protein